MAADFHMQSLTHALNEDSDITVRRHAVSKIPHTLDDDETIQS